MPLVEDSVRIVSQLRRAGQVGDRWRSPDGMRAVYNAPLHVLLLAVSDSGSRVRKIRDRVMCRNDASDAQPHGPLAASQAAAAAIDGVRLVTELPKTPPRPNDAHKGTFGSILVIAGSEGMGGAACLAGRAALHGGAGLVTVAIPRSIATIVAVAHPSYMTIPCDEVDGKLSEQAVTKIEHIFPRHTAVAIGPGLGQAEDVRKVVRHIYQYCDLPLALDADGINAFAGAAAKLLLRNDHAPRVLTPHPGEFARLTGHKVADIQSHREAMAVEFARRHELTLLLKGPATVITDGERIAINPTGNSGMATGGSGDVLTGLVGALLAQRMGPFEAAQLAAYLQGLAADTAAATHTKPFMTSLELLDHLDNAWRIVLDRELTA